jgi:hypothetical protein
MALMARRSMRPPAGSSCRLITRMMSEPMLMGMRTDSTIKGISFISGMTRRSALAAPVEVSCRGPYFESISTSGRRLNEASNDRGFPVP